MHRNRVTILPMPAQRNPEPGLQGQGGDFKRLVRCNQAAALVSCLIGKLVERLGAATAALRGAAEEKSYFLLLRLLSVGGPGVHMCVCCLCTYVGRLQARASDGQPKHS